MAIRHKQLRSEPVAGRTWTALAFVLALLAGSAGARENDAWKHPDPRLAAVDTAVDDDNFASAQKLLASLRAEAKQNGDNALQAEVLERGKEVGKLARGYEKLSRHLTTLKKNPKDPKSSLAVGKFYCVDKGDFERGLPFLAAGEDANLAEVAALESARVDETDQQLAIADRWWQSAEKATELNERIAWQIQARKAMLQARPAASETQRATIDRRLNKVLLHPERIIVWNTHNGPSNDRGAEQVHVSLLYENSVVWNQAVDLPFQRDEPSFVMLRPKRIRADEVRVEITRHHNRGGGLGEIEVFVGRTNVAAGCEPLVDAVWELNAQFVPSRLIDGDRSGATGYWLTDNDKDGWAAIPFSEFRSPK